MDRARAIFQLPSSNRFFSISRNEKCAAVVFECSVSRNEKCTTVVLECLDFRINILYVVHNGEARKSRSPFT